jgi:hypothetical protein
MESARANELAQAPQAEGRITVAKVVDVMGEANGVTTGVGPGQLLEEQELALSSQLLHYVIQHEGSFIQNGTFEQPEPMQSAMFCTKAAQGVALLHLQLFLP